MAKGWGFIGGSFTSEAVSIDCQRTANLYAEALDPKSKSPSALISIPGLATFCTLPTSPLRGLFSQDERAFAVAGTVFYELFEGGTYLLRGGGLIDDGKPATLDSNGSAGHQLLVSAGRRAGVFDLTTNVFTPDVLTNADMCGFCDGVGVALDASDSTLYISDEEDFSTWDLAVKAQRNTASDPYRAIAVVNRNIWAFGAETSDVWYDAGASPFPFEPFSGGFVQTGIIAPRSVALIDNSLIWLGVNTAGGVGIFRTNGFQALRVSTHAIEQTVLQYGTVDDARAWSYGDRGHSFYVLTFPTANTPALVYDAATGLWAERSFWNTSTGLEETYRPNCHCYVWGTHLVGDYENGTVYQMSASTYTDAGGVPLRRLRQGPYVCNEMQWIYARDFWLDIETGVGNILAPGVTPEAMFSYSDDGGRTWRGESWRSFGVLGAYRQRVQWKRLGRFRQRAPRIVISDPVPVRIADAYAEAD
jgi:hypothetical protein